MLALLLTAALAVAPTPANNTECPVMHEKVNPAKATKGIAFGREYFLCCSGCKAKLEKDPGKYVNAKDGSIKPKA